MPLAGFGGEPSRSFEPCLRLRQGVFKAAEVAVQAVLATSATRDNFALAIAKFKSKLIQLQWRWE